MLYFDNFSHEETKMNVSSSACLIFFAWWKTWNQLKCPAHRAREILSCCNEWPPTSSPDMWSHNSPDLNPVDYRNTARACVSRMWMSWNCVWSLAFTRRLINGECVLMHVSTSRESTLNACFTTVNNVFLVLKLTLVFCFKFLYESRLFFSFDRLSLKILIFLLNSIL